MIFKDENSVLSLRKIKGNDDELHFYKARIYDDCKPGDDRLQVRIVPYMSGIPKEECSNLPKYPSLFKGKVIRGYSEKNPNPATKAADLVVVLANSDFTYGYVVDLMSTFEGCGDKKFSNSWSYKQTKQALQKFKCTGDGSVDYKDIYIDTVNSAGNFIEFHSISTGSKWIMNGFGDMLYIGPHNVILTSSAGSGKDDKQYSQIRISPTKIQFISELADFTRCKKVILSAHGHNMVSTIQSSPAMIDGFDLAPVSNVFC